MSRVAAVVGDHGRLVDTVVYVLREVRDAAQETSGSGSVSFLVPIGDGPDCLRAPAADALADRVRAVVDEEPLAALDVDAVTVSVDGDNGDGDGDDGASGSERVRALVEALPVGTVRVVLMPGFDEFTPTAMRSALGDRSIAVERAPVGRRVRPLALAAARSPRRLAATFALAFGFYLALGNPTDPFDIVTGAISAVAVAAVLSGVVFEREPSRATLGALVRAIVFLPYLLAAVVRANLGLAAVVLDPRLPIDPVVVRIPAPESRLARALLANSITLTPGTLTIDVAEDELLVHALTAGTRAELLEGSLARAVAFVTGDTARDGGSTTPVDGRLGGEP